MSDLTLRERSVLLMVMSTSFLAPFMGSALNLALPSIGSEFHSGPVELSYIASSYILGSAAFLLPFGRLADIVGREKIYLAGIFLFGLFAQLSGMATSLETMLIFRLCHGSVSAMIFSTGMALLTAVFPAKRRGYAIGMSAAVTYLGLSIGPVLGGFMSHNLGWRSLFYFTALLSAATALFAWKKLDWRNAVKSQERYDWSGALSYLGAISLTLYSLSMFSRLAWAKYGLTTGLTWLAFFLYHQAKREQPLFPVRLFLNNPLFLFSNLAALINYSATFALSFLLSLHLQLVLKLEADFSGLILLALPLFMALISPFAGRLSDRIQPGILASCGMALCTLSLFAFSFLSAETSLEFILVNLIISGIGFALFSSPNNNAIMGAVDKQHYGSAASALATMRLLGQAISMAIVSLLLSLHSGSKNGAAVSAAAHDAFLVFTALCAFGIVASLARGKSRH